MPPVNDGNPNEVNIATGPRRNINPRWLTEASVNCSLCTAAAVLNHSGLGLPHMTSGAVAGELNVQYQSANALPVWRKQSNNPLEQLYLMPNSDQEMNSTGMQMQNQIEGIYHYCRGKMGFCSSSVIGNAKQMYPHELCDKWMRKQKEGTLFAVFFIVMFVEHSGSHWVFARKTATGLTYIDYQTDTPNGAGPTVADKPLIGILGSNYSASDLKAMKMAVVAFRPGETGPMRPA